MMVEIYVSWCRGLPKDKEALEIIRGSGLIDGIETSEILDIDEIKESGVKTSIHRPFRWEEFNLEDDNIPENNKEEISKYNESDASVLGFHLIDYKKENNRNNVDIVKNFKNNLKKLENMFDKKIVFELQPYDSHIIETRKENAEYFTDKEIVKELIQSSNSGILLDMSHTYVSGMNKIQKGLYKGDIKEYFKEILDVSKDKIWQLHVNVPEKTNKEYVDTHNTFEDNPTSEEIIELLEYVLEECKNLELITLEVYTNLSPIEHAKKTVEQIEKLNKILNLKK